MASLANLSGRFTQEDLNNLRVFKAVMSVGCAVMSQVFQWGCQNKSTEKTLEEYLLQDKNMKKKKFRNLFNKTMLNIIRSNPSCDQFDISLLLLAIKVACDGVASRDNDVWHIEDTQQLEYNLTRLKNERNETAHDVKPISDVQMKDKIEEIRNLLVRIINQSCIRFTINSVTETQTLDDINRLLDYARDQPLSGSETMHLHKQLQMEHIIYIIKHKGSEELRRKYKSLSYITPLSFIDGSNIMTDVESIFSDIEIVESGRNNTGESIEIDDLLQLSNFSDKTSNFPDKTSNIPDTAINIPDIVMNIPDTASNISDTSSNIHDKTNNIHDKTSNIHDKTSSIHDKTSNIHDKTSKKPDKTSNIHDKTSKKPDKTSKKPDKTSNISDTGSMTIVDGCAGAGKTTLTKMLMSEWSKPSTTIKQLLDYDLLLLMECRNSYINSLSELFENLMPNTCAMTQDNMTRCARNLKILFLVDGLDELNKTSKQVFSEIVEVCRNGDHKIFCTSRPEKLKDLYKMISGKLELRHMHINGVSVEQRGRFVKQYTTHLKWSEDCIKELLEFLDEPQARLNEFYRFPLNLMMLTYLWAEKPMEMKNIMTTTELYQQMIDLMVEKLLGRLKHLDSTRDICVADMEAKIKSLLSELYCQAFLSFKENEILISKVTSQKLKDLCSDLGLPTREVLSAFLVMKVLWTKTGTEEQLSFPHKDMHDYFAAKCLYLAITDAEFCSVLKTSHLRLTPKKTAWKSFFGSSRPNKINELLKEMLQINLNSAKLAKFQNLIKHLAGLLYGTNSCVNDQEGEELMQLLSNSGISDEDQWFDVLGAAKYDQRIAKYIATNILKSKIKITDARIKVFLSLMSYAKLKRVNLDISSDPDNLPGLMELLGEVAKQDCQVSVFFHHHFRHPEENKTSDKFLKCVLGTGARCRVEKVWGHLSGEVLTRMDNCMTLYTAVISDKHARAMKVLSPRILCTGLHVLPAVSPEALPHIQEGDFVDKLFNEVSLFCSHITDGQVGWVSNMARRLINNESFHSIRLPESQLSRHGCEDLIDSLAERGVRVTGRHFNGGGLWVSSPHLSKGNIGDLYKSAEVKLGRGLYVKQKKKNWTTGDIWTDI